jgi:N-acylneuraminate cytidylyltransferase/CMP-N,N'-diacetyllegionaminic acid synthase
MYKEKKILALIPARGGSKGLPRKNIVPLLGKPLIAWTIEEALSSKYLDGVIVSTEDEEIARIARKYGAETPFKRPKQLARDSSKGIDVVLHAIDWFKKKGNRYDLLMLLQPTSPLRTVEDIDGSVEYFFTKQGNVVVSVCEAEHSPLWTNTLPDDMCMKNFINLKFGGLNRQELPKYYRLNGAIYLSFCDHLQREKSFFGKGTSAYIMPKEKSVDIDGNFDFNLAEFILSRRLKEIGK